MKKAFSLMELVIAVAILSVVMISLIQVRTNNITLLSKVKERSILNDYVLLAMDLQKPNNRNEIIRLDDKYKFDHDEFRKELKEIKVKREDEEYDSIDLTLLDSIETKVNVYSTIYSIDNKIKKNIYSFEIEL